MKYYKPLNETDENASYVNGDIATGTPGSLPDAKGFESTQREIVNAILAAGLTPNGENLNQLSEAIAISSKHIANVPLWSAQEQDHVLSGDEAAGWLLAGNKTGLEHGVANQMIADAWAGGVPERLINRNVAVPFTTSTSGTAFNNVGDVHIRIGAGEFVHTLSNPTEYVFIRQSIANNIPYAKFSSMIISAVLEDGTTTVVHSFTSSDGNNEKTFEGILSFEKKIIQIKLTGTVINAGSGNGTSGMAAPLMIVANAIPYRQAVNGWMIVDSTYKANVDALFTSTGMAPFYIRDAGDGTIWAPHYAKRELKYSNYTDEGYGYSIYSDGWCEIQGSYLATIAVAPNSGKTVTVLLPFEIEMDNSKYIPTIQWINGGGNYPILSSVITTKSKKSFYVSFWNGNGSSSGDLRGFTYKVSGYVSSETMQSFGISPIYTYYRIGNQIKDPQLILAQEALAQLNNLTNNKADKFATENATIFTATGKENIWKYVSVKETGIQLPTLPRGGEYTAPSNGRFTCYCGLAGHSVRILYGSGAFPVASAYTIANESNGCSYPVTKGQKIILSYSSSQSNVLIVFIPQEN